MIELRSKQDLERLIHDGIREDLHLEFKSGAALENGDKERNELSKDLSAMANADGGQVIYGLSEDRARGSASGFAPVDGSRYTRETIEQVARSKISPPIEGLSVHPIPLSELSSDMAFVIDVPRALALGPHQASDRKYYKRHGTTIEAMADYEVRDAMHRVIRPVLDMQINWGLRPFQTQFGGKPIFANATITNASPEPALYVAATVFADARLTTLDSPFAPDFAISSPSGATLHGRTLELAARNHFPIFRERPARLPTISWILPDWSQQPIDLDFAYRVIAPGHEKLAHLKLRVSESGITILDR